MPFVVSPRFLCREGTSLFPSTYVPPRGSSTLDLTRCGSRGAASLHTGHSFIGFSIVTVWLRGWEKVANIGSNLYL